MVMVLDMVHMGDVAHRDMMPDYLGDAIGNDVGNEIVIGADAAHLHTKVVSSSPFEH